MARKDHNPEHQPSPDAEELHDAADEALAKGYIGTVPDPHENREYSLQSGPDSPSLVTEPNVRLEPPKAPELPAEKKEG